MTTAPVNSSGKVSVERRFLGVRYGLACWLDELFVNYTTWDALWNEQKLEMELYGSNDRAWKFWEQASLAEKRQATDALECYFLCAELGFRGDLADEPAKLEAWLAGVRAQLARTQARPWIAPPEREPATHVPPLRPRTSATAIHLFDLAPDIPVVLGLDRHLVDHVGGEAFGFKARFEREQVEPCCFGPAGAGKACRHRPASSIDARATGRSRPAAR